MRANDPSNALTGEFIADVAGAFFDARCRLEAMIAAFEASVARLRRRADEVAGDAAALWHLFPAEELARSLFCRLGVAADPFARAARQAVWRSPLVVPKVLGRRRRYVRTVQEAYGRLARQVRRYQQGPPETAEPAPAAVYYHLVREMARLVNLEIRAVDTQMGPSETLQYVKQFNPCQIERERITGGGCPGAASGLDAGLAFRPIRFEALDLPDYPLLPSLAQVRAQVGAAAREAFAADPEAARRLLQEARRR